MLDFSSPVPLYYQLAELFREQIRMGELEAGTRLPSENALAATFGVGRPTVRQGTELLVRQGLLQRRRGAGTFVRQRVPEVDLFDLAGTMTSFRDKNLPLGTLNFDGAPGAIFAMLHCRTDELVFAQTIGGATHE